MTGDKNVLAMRSAVNWVLLGLLIERPSYGYELVQRFERTFGNALELSSPSQIYGALNALERRSLIERLPATDAESEALRQPKPHYRPTAEGVRSYQHWLVAHTEEEHRRSDLFACQLAMLGPEAALVALKRYEQTCLDALARVSIDTVPDSMIDEKDRLAAQLVREKKRLVLGAELAWAHYARSQLKVLAARPERSLVPDDGDPVDSVSRILNLDVSPDEAIRAMRGEPDPE